MEFAKIFITLAALINPFGAIPAFIGLTQGQSSLERRRTARTAALATVLVITVTALAGQYLLAGFGITVPSLQVGGGVLLFIVAISMFNAQPAPSRTTPEEADEAAERANIAVVPLTIPLLTGPGTVSTVIIYADQGTNTVLMLLGALGKAGAVPFHSWIPLAADDAPQPIEGDWPFDKIVVIAFPGEAEARRFAEDPEYKTISRDSHAGAETVSLLVTGLGRRG